MNFWTPLSDFKKSLRDLFRALGYPDSHAVKICLLPPCAKLRKWRGGSGMTYMLYVGLSSSLGR